MKALDGVQSRCKIIVQRNDDAHAVDGREACDPELMGAVRVGEQDVTAVRDGYTRKQRRVIDLDGLCGRERLGRRSNDDSGG